MLSIICYLVMCICSLHLIISKMMISNDLMESFEWKTEDWGKNRSLVLSKSKQALTNIGILHKFANFVQRKSSQAETREQIVTDFWDPIHPKKVPSVIFATILNKTGLFLWHFHVPWIFGTVFWRHVTTADYFHLGIEFRGLFLLQYLI
jgi:hypothetical protein